jgi:hypothetical protein
MVECLALLYSPDVVVLIWFQKMDTVFVAFRSLIADLRWKLSWNERQWQDRNSIAYVTIKQRNSIIYKVNIAMTASK